MSTLEEVHKASKQLVQEMVAKHQHNDDFVRGLRFIFASMPDSEESPFVRGFADLLTHMENMQRVAMSYHQAVDEHMKAERVH